jgi:hypothetical protein
VRGRASPREGEPPGRTRSRALARHVLQSEPLQHRASFDHGWVPQEGPASKGGGPGSGGAQLASSAGAGMTTAGGGAASAHAGTGGGGADPPQQQATIADSAAPTAVPVTTQRIFCFV